MASYRVLVPLAILFPAAVLVTAGAFDDPPPKNPPPKKVTVDAVQEAQAPPRGLPKRAGAKAPAAEAVKAPLSRAVKTQPAQGGVERGFDLSLDPHGASHVGQTFEETMAADIKEKAGVMQAQRQLLEERYNLTPRLDPEAKMSGGKPLPVGPTARLPEGLTWEELAQTPNEQIRTKNLFPYPALPHVKQATGGMVFPKVQTDAFPRLVRFDVDFDLPEAFLPEFPPPIFLRNRPELGDVSQGEVVSINNFHRLFKEILTPVQLDGLRLLVTPFPQEEFNPTDDRKHEHASLGVACFDCHVNGHTTGQFHLTPDVRPQQRRMRLDTVSLRGIGDQQIHGSKRSLRSVEDFTEFEFRTAYFNGDPIRAMKKGFPIFDRIQVSHMAQLQNMIDLPPAPKLTTDGKLYQAVASASEKRGEQLFFGKARCVECHPAPFYLDHQMHDLRLERFVNEPAIGPMKTFTLRGIKDSPPYMHDGRCLTLEDTVELFNLILETRLTVEEKKDLVAFLRCL